MFILIPEKISVVCVFVSVLCVCVCGGGNICMGKRERARRGHRTGRVEYRDQSGS